MQVGDLEKITPVADEDLERSDEHKTSAVHFLRFELDTQARSALEGGAALAFGIDHAAYVQRVSPIPDTVRESLLHDLE